MLSTYARDAVLDHVLGTSAWTSPASVWVKLHVGDPSSDGTANSASNAVRKQLTAGASSAGSAANSGTISWSADETNDEAVSHISLWDAATGGNCLFVDGLSAPVLTAAGFAFSFPTGNLTISSI